MSPTWSPGARRGIAAVLGTAGATAALVAPAHAASVPVSQPLVALLGDRVARTAPTPDAHRIEVVPGRRPLTGVRTVLPVIGTATSRAGKRWVHVRLPGRPSGHTGWIRRDRTHARSTEWSIAVRLSTRRVTVFRDGRVTRRFPAIVGKPSTPTPRGSFFVEEALALSPAEAGGPYALATSARSSVLQQFDGGPGQIALHGVDNLSGTLGTAVSHGCIRLSGSAITWLARRIGAGVPVTVSR